MAKHRQSATEKPAETPEAPTLDETRLQVCQLYLQNGLIEDAYTAFGGIFDDEIRNNLIKSSQALWKEFNRRLKKPGSFVYFGSFPQIASSNTHSSILWKTLDVDGNYSLLITQKALWKSPFHRRSMNDITLPPFFAESWLERVLNIMFVSPITFTDEESSMIVPIYQPGMQVLRNPSYPKGPSFYSAAFILNTEQVKRYFPTDKDRKCYPTSYALVRKIMTPQENRLEEAKKLRADATSKPVSWWVRDTYEWDNDWNEWTIAFVNQQGGVGNSGMSADSDMMFVRPAIWIRNDL